MAKNDLILIDSIIDKRVADKYPSEKKDEVFEYLAYEQVLKEYDLSVDEIQAGSVDGRNDGGIDAIFILHIVKYSNLNCIIQSRRSYCFAKKSERWD